MRETDNICSIHSNRSRNFNVAKNLTKIPANKRDSRCLLLSTLRRLPGTHQSSCTGPHRPVSSQFLGKPCNPRSCRNRGISWSLTRSRCIHQ